MKNLIISTFLTFIASFSMAQEFSFTPEKPQPGQEITVTYKPLNNLETKIYAYQMIDLERSYELDLDVKKVKGAYEISVTPSHKADFVYFEIYVSETFDNNNGNGYYILLYDGEKPKKDTYGSLTDYYMFKINKDGLRGDMNKVLATAENELKYHPENYRFKMTYYYNTLLELDEDKAMKLIEVEKNEMKGKNLKSDGEYEHLQFLYSVLGQDEEIERLEDEKRNEFPYGTWYFFEKTRDFLAAEDLTEKERSLDILMSEVEKHYSPDTEMFSVRIKPFQGELLSAYAEKGDYETYRKLVRKYDFDPQEGQDEWEWDAILESYIQTAWAMQKAETNLDYASDLAKLAMSSSEKQWKSTIENNNSLERQNKYKLHYSNALAAYIMVLSKQGDVQGAFENAEKIAMEVNGGKVKDFNDLFLTIGEEVLSPEELKNHLESFVKNGGASDKVKDKLKSYFGSGDEAAFDEYILGLEDAVREEKRLKKKAKMIAEPAADFELVNLKGEKVKLSDFKGKNVIIDFWATWCGPCIAAFPAMEIAQEELGDRLEFLFVNTFERGEPDVKTEKVGTFIEENNYPFEVLMDFDNKIAGKYRVNGIPAQFMVDKEGNVRFRSTGFGGSTVDYLEELRLSVDLMEE